MRHLISWNKCTAIMTCVNNSTSIPGNLLGVLGPWNIVKQHARCTPVLDDRTLLNPSQWDEAFGFHGQSWRYEVSHHDAWCPCCDSSLKPIAQHATISLQTSLHHHSTVQSNMSRTLHIVKYIHPQLTLSFTRFLAICKMIGRYISFPTLLQYT